MSKEDVIDYVMTTPSNPNKAVLEGMLDSIADAGVFIVKMTTEDAYPNQLTLTPDKTREEAIAAYNEGKAVIAIVEEYTGRGASWSNAMVLAYGTEMDVFSGSDIIFAIPNATCASLVWSPYVNGGSPRLDFLTIATSQPS